MLRFGAPAESCRADYMQAFTTGELPPPGPRRRTVHRLPAEHAFDIYNVGLQGKARRGLMVLF